jgi:hypothetical protein
MGGGGTCDSELWLTAPRAGAVFGVLTEVSESLASFFGCLSVVSKFTLASSLITISGAVGHAFNVFLLAQYTCRTVADWYLFDCGTCLCVSVESDLD